MLVECKWASRSVGVDVFQELESKAPAISHELGNGRVIYALCSRSGYTKQLEALSVERKDIHLYNWPAMLAEI